MAASAVERLIHHYSLHARELPWRSPPGASPPDPYRVWLSEVMLQQTSVATVMSRFTRFVDRWPTVEALAAAPDEEILSEWAGLGYYARARNLVACARIVAQQGGFPHSEAELRTLPGIGDYTAAAIAAIAFGEKATPVDTNIERVTARLHALTDRKAIVEAARSMTPEDRAGDFAQAMMDLGATVCRPRNPQCERCPLSPDCRAFALGTPEAFPPPKTKKARPVRHGTAWWIERDGALWLMRRPDKGMLGGMAAMPGTDWADGAHRGTNRPIIRHVFTHFALELAVEERESPPGEDGWWQPLDRLDEAGLPTLYRKAAEAYRKARTQALDVAAPAP